MPGSSHGASLVALERLLLGRPVGAKDIDLWRPEDLTGTTSQARHSYLQWAVAHYYMRFYGAVPEEWLITASELFEAGLGSVRFRSAGRRGQRRSHDR